MSKNIKQVAHCRQNVINFDSISQQECSDDDQQNHAEVALDDLLLNQSPEYQIIDWLKENPDRYARYLELFNKNK